VAVLELLGQLRQQVDALGAQVATCTTELTRIEKALTEVASGHRETTKQVTLLMKIFVAHTKVAATIAGALEDLKKRTG
jgi:chaperonin cofactor prefoldin